MARPQRLMVVEDEPCVLELLVRYVQDLGWEARGVSDGQAALDELLPALALPALVLPALVLTDVTMPRLDGLGLLQEIKKTLPRLPVVVMSADANQRPAALRGGAQAFLLKPFGREELREVIQRRNGDGGGILHPAWGDSPPV